MTENEREKRLTPEREKELREYFAGQGPIGMKGQEVFAEIDALRVEVANLKAPCAWEEAWEAERALTRASEEVARAETEQLLSDHQAEVERLTAERDEEARRKGLAEAAVSRALATARTARDAALEEVAVELARAKASEARERWTGGLGRGERLLAEEQRIIRALKSQPARQYVDAEKVREALLTWRIGSETCNREFTLRGVANALGVDLDAKGEHPNIQRPDAQVMRSIEHTVRERTTAEADFYEQGGFIPPEG